MKIGMLWLDNDKKSSLEAKVTKAAAYYEQKYGKAPTTCFVHPSMLPTEQATGDQERIIAGVEIRCTRSVLPNHFWIGLSDQSTAP
jgi:hypothetical protein